MQPEDPYLSTASGQIVLSAEKPFYLGSLLIDAARRSITRRDGQATKVEPRMLQVLVQLAKAEGEIVSRADLNARCWQGRAVTDDAQDRVIAKLRRFGKEFGDNQFEIDTIPRVGFQLRARPPVAGDNRKAVSRRVALAGSAAALVGVGAGVYGVWHNVTAPSRDPTRVAVFPFDNLSVDPSLAFLAAGLARQVRDTLSRVAGLRLTGEPSSQTIAAARLDPREAGRRLGADWLVRGSVQADGVQMRIATELIEAPSRTIVWSQSFEGQADKLFKAQDEVSRAVLREIIGRTDPTDKDLPTRRPRDSRVFRLTLEGDDLFEKSRTARMDGDVEVAFDAADRAAALAAQALAIDASDPAALLLMARLTRGGWTRAMTAEPLSPDERVVASLAYVTRALAADPNDPGALTALGDYYRRFEWRWTEAETLFRKALSISPSYIEAHWSYGYMLGTTGRALQGLRHAYTVFELDPQTTWRRVALPRLLDAVGERDEAARHYAVELEATPANLFLISELYIIALTMGGARSLEALAARVRALNAGKRSPKLEDSLARMIDAATARRGQPAALIARIDADVAAFDAPRSLVAAQQARAGVDLLFIYALEYAWAGAIDRSITLFKRAFAARSLWWPLSLPFGNAPLPAVIRNDQRYRALWSNDQAMRQLFAMRARALSRRQMAGFASSGTLIRPSSTAIRAAATML